MSKHATGDVEIKSWDEETTQEMDDGRKVTRAAIKAAYKGTIEGESSLQYLMAYRPDGTATYVGLEHIKGRVDGKSGAFVVQHTGEWRDNAAHTTLHIVAGSGTGQLEGIQGKGSANATHDALPYDLEYELG